MFASYSSAGAERRRMACALAPRSRPPASTPGRRIPRLPADPGSGPRAARRRRPPRGDCATAGGPLVGGDQQDSQATTTLARADRLGRVRIDLDPQAACASRAGSVNLVPALAARANRSPNSGRPSAAHTGTPRGDGISSPDALHRARLLLPSPRGARRPGDRDHHHAGRRRLRARSSRTRPRAWRRITCSRRAAPSAARANTGRRSTGPPARARSRARRRRAARRGSVPPAGPAPAPPAQ